MKLYGKRSWVWIYATRFAVSSSCFYTLRLNILEEISLTNFNHRPNITSWSNKRGNRVLFCNINIPDMSLNMPIEYIYSSRQSGSDKSHRPALRSRTQTFIDLSSRFSALPVTSSSFSSSTIYKREDAGRITTAYAITVTAINNGKDNYPRKREDKSVTYVTETGDTATAAVRVVTIKKPYAVDKPLPLTPIESPINAVESLRKRNPHISTEEKKIKSIPRSSRVGKTSTNNIIEQAGELDIVDIDGNKFPFRNLYSFSSDFPFMEKSPKHEKVMTIFIRPSFCCRVSPSFLRISLSEE